MPSVFLRLMEELKAPESAVSKVASLIAKDVGMTCKLLQLVNSSFFGLPRRIESPEHAARLLGLERLRPLVLSAGIFSQLDGISSSGLSLDRISEHGLATSVVARLIVGLECRDTTLAQDAALAAILIDVGQLILLQSHGRRYVDVVEQAHKDGVPVWEAEVREFGASHAIVGAHLLSLWGMPDIIVEAAAFHHTPRESSHRGFSLLAAVHVASALHHNRFSPEDPASGAALDLEFLRESNLADRFPIWQQAANTAWDQVTS
jgi:HD-like signal output (HDOD) protein